MLSNIRHSFNFSKHRIVLCLALFVIAISFDQLTKSWARNALSEGPKFIGNTQIGFSLTSNSGSAFSLFQNSTILLTISACLIVGILLFAAFRTNSNALSISYMVIAAGATGNIIDRFTQPPGGGHGHVTDFIKIGSFPTFNIADSLVTIGAVSLVVFSFINSKEAK